MCLCVCLCLCVCVCVCSFIQQTIPLASEHVCSLSTLRVTFYELIVHRVTLFTQILTILMELFVDSEQTEYTSSVSI